MIRIGILGAARIAPKAIIEPARRRTDCRVVAVAARDAARAADYAEEHGIQHVAESYEALIARNDVDLIYNALPPNRHADLTIAALTGCAVRGTAIPASLQEFRITSYFSSSLHLMALSAARRYYPQCVHGDAEVHSARSDGDAPAEPTTTVFAGSARPSGKLTLDELPGFGRVPIEASRGRSTAFPAAYNH